MKSILTEIVLSAGAIVFWALALPAAIVAFPAITLYEKTANLLARGTADHGRRVTTSVLAATGLPGAVPRLGGTSAPERLLRCPPD